MHSGRYDSERVARFQREARVLASLNHPNIAAIYGVEAIDGCHFLVMELIPEKTLADRIKHGAIPIEEALLIAKQIAEAFEAAHEKGVIHRDLKPANVKITPEGKVNWSPRNKRACTRPDRRGRWLKLKQKCWTGQEDRVVTTDWRRA